MKSDVNTEPIHIVRLPPVVRKPGRPRAIPKELEIVVLELYGSGYGYRAIARILRMEYHVDPNFSTVKRTLKRLGILSRPDSPSKANISKGEI